MPTKARRPKKKTGKTSKVAKKKAHTGKTKAKKRGLVAKSPKSKRAKLSARAKKAAPKKGMKPHKKKAVKARPPKKVVKAKAVAKSVAKVAKATPKPKLAPVATAAKGKRGRGKRVCRETGCSLPRISDGYCRLHYIKNWQDVINSRKQQARVNLNKYIESISERYPDDFMDRLRDDLGNENKFKSRLRELGFREEYETSGDNPFQADNFSAFVHSLKFDE